MKNMQYISSFLTRVEGPLQVRGYIPCHVIGGGTANYRGGPNPERYQAMGASGVTIATGCDLGQTDQKTLCQFGLPARIAELFRPYYGKRKTRAIEVLHKKPLTISEAQARLLNEAVHNGYLDCYVRPAYDGCSAVKFDDVPPQAQAVIMSLCFQKGCGGVRRDWPKVWDHLTHQRWREASQELCTGFTQYISRRKTEGALLREIL